MWKFLNNVLTCRISFSLLWKYHRVSIYLTGDDNNKAYFNCSCVPACMDDVCLQMSLSPSPEPVGGHLTLPGVQSLIRCLVTEKTCHSRNNYVLPSSFLTPPWPPSGSSGICVWFKGRQQNKTLCSCTSTVLQVLDDEHRPELNILWGHEF